MAFGAGAEDAAGANLVDGVLQTLQQGTDIVGRARLADAVDGLQDLAEVLTELGEFLVHLLAVLGGVVAHGQTVATTGS